MKTLFLGLILVLGFGSFDAAYGQRSRTVSVRVHHEKPVARTGLRVRFVEMVEDSRCPADTNCIWAGNAKIRVRVSQNRRSKIIELNSGMENKDARFAGYEFKLTGLTPEPRSNVRINRNGYVATIEATRL